MSARGIPVQDEYPDWLQLVPAQEREPEEPFESLSVRRRKAVQQEDAAPVAPVAEAPVVEEPAADEAAE